MGYFDTELRTTVIYAVLAIVIGSVSFLLNSTALSVVLAVVVFLASWAGLKRVLKINEDKRFWFTMAVLYFFLWLVVWTLLYNVVVR